MTTTYNPIIYGQDDITDDENDEDKNLTPKIKRLKCKKTTI